MKKRGNRGFTLVEIVVTMALMGVVLSVVSSALLLMNKNSSNESGFSSMLGDLTTTQSRVEQFIGQQDAAVITFSTQKKCLCVYDETGWLECRSLLEEQITSAVFSHTIATNAEYCSFAWQVGEEEKSYSFDVLAWINSETAWVDTAEKALCRQIYGHFDDAPLTYTISDDGASLSVTGTVTKDGAPKQETITVSAAGYSVAASFAKASEEQILCTLTKDDTTYTFNISLPTYVLRAKCEVLRWVKENCSARAAGFSFGVADTVLRATNTETFEETLLCYVNGSVTDYEGGRLRRNQTDNHLLLLTNTAPVSIDNVSSLSFQLKNRLGVLCTVTHKVRGQDTAFDFLVQCHAANLSEQ